MPAQAYIHPLLGVEYGEWTWCFRCERVHRTARWVANGWSCPGCSAGSLDAYDWSPETWPRHLHPEYLNVPVDGRRYPLRSGGVDPMDR